VRAFAKPQIGERGNSEGRCVLGVVDTFALMKFDELTTERLRLAPFDECTARAVLAGDLEGINAGEGWPHKGTINGLSMAIEHGESPGWMVILDETVIGDCGTHGGADETGVIEIGYGLAEPFRGRKYGTELVGAMTEWLLAQPGIRAVGASTLADNVASRLVLEKNGFLLTGHDANGQAIYQRREHDQSPVQGPAIRGDSGYASDALS
jgi:RimJ/RimL family protein N-acetyltransferase